MTIDLTKSIVLADNNLSTKNNGIVADSYIVAPDAPMLADGYNPTASGIFVPHTMYDPNTGVAYYAGTQALHMEYSALGYVHYIPATSASIQQTSTIIATSTIDVPSAPVVASTTTTTTTTTNNTGTTNTGNGGSTYTPPPGY